MLAALPRGLTHGSPLRRATQPLRSVAMAAVPDICLDEFALRQFDDENYAGTRLSSISKDAFMEKVTEYWSPRRAMATEFVDRPALVDGYAPFCKHIFMPNFVPGLVTPVVKIAADNEGSLRTRYVARSEGELPVLIRYFPVGSVTAPPCTWLDLILYSREQIAKENEATGRRSGELGPSPWRLISVKAQNVPHETPMQPITMMRNAILSEGGSGVAIDRAAYAQSVAYWSEHAPIA